MKYQKFVFFKEYNGITLTTLRNPPKKYKERNSSPIPVSDLKYVSETKQMYKDESYIFIKPPKPLK